MIFGGWLERVPRVQEGEEKGPKHGTPAKPSQGLGRKEH